MRRLGKARVELARAFALALGCAALACERDPEEARDAGAACGIELTDVSLLLLGDGQVECHAIERQTCGLPEGVHTLDGSCSFALSDCLELCPTYGAYRCKLEDASCGPEGGVLDGAVPSVACSVCPQDVGRRPAGLSDDAPRAAATALGDWLARVAHLEAASVRAFHVLGRELTLHGAGRELVRAAERAARDEIVHARVATRLAAKHGARPARVRSAAPVTRSLLDIACENAIEGCVRETFGALSAAWQARHARDAELALHFKRVARDEARHAALAWAVDAWLCERLTPSQRELVLTARARAASALAASFVEPPRELRMAAGLPGLAAQRALHRELSRSLGFERVAPAA